MSAPQDPESHWATRGVIAWLRVPTLVKSLAIMGVVTFGIGTGLSAISIGGTRSYDRFSSSEESCPVVGSNVPGGEDPWGGCFPGPGNTGVPAGVTPTTYTGSPVAIDGDNDLTVSTNNVTINAKVIGTRGTPVHIRVNATNFTLSNSILYGTIEQLDPADSFTVIDSVVDSYGDTDRKSAVGSNITLTRSEFKGSFSGGVCDNCTVTDSWFHAQWVPSDSTAHMSGYRMDNNVEFTHNVFSCDFDATGLDPEAGCSADMTGYGDWAPVEFNTIHRNLFISNPQSAYYCAYGGSSGGGGGKPFGDDANHVVFTQNVFQRGPYGTCGNAGPIVDFNPAEPGNVWSGNVWDDGDALSTPSFP